MGLVIQSRHFAQKSNFSGTHLLGGGEAQCEGLDDELQHSLVVVVTNFVPVKAQVWNFCRVE